jgi:hypothetical protein
MRSLLAVAIGLLGWHALPAQVAEAVYPSGAGVGTNTKVLVRFTCCIIGATTPVVLRAGALTVAGTTEFVGNEWILFTPTQALQANTAYAVTVTLPGRAPFTGDFTTGASPVTVAPKLASSYPANLQDVVDLNQPIRLRFSRPLNPKSVFASQPRLAFLGPGNYSIDTKAALPDAYTLELSGFGQLNPGGVYQVSFSAAPPQDLSGNVLPLVVPDFLFTTYPQAPKDGARLSLSTPADSETGVPTNSAIVLQFSRPIPLPDAAAFTLSATGDLNVGLSVEADQRKDVLVLRPRTLLRGNRQYTLSVGDIYDAFGGKVAAGPLLSFTTATLPESRGFSQLSGPSPILPNLRKARWVFNRAVSPIQIPPLYSARTNTYIPVRLLEDGVTLECDLEGPGQYFQTRGVYDRVESKLYSTYSSFVVTSTPDDQPPALLVTFPPDQAIGIPPDVKPTIQFSEPLEYSQSPDRAQLWQGGTRLAATVTTYSDGYQLAPNSPLSAGLEYRIVLPAPRDLAGNTGPDVIWSFRVDVPTAQEPFRLLQVQPAPNTLGVSADAPIVFTLNRPANPVNVLSSYCQTVTSGFGTIPGRWRVEGDNVIFHPNEPLPPVSRIVWRGCGFADYSGQILPPSDLTGAFWTAASDEPAPALRVVRITPANGETSFVRGTIATLQFNQALADSTVQSDSFVVTNKAGNRVSVTALYRPSTKEVALTLSSGEAGELTITATSEVRSLRGARLEPFSSKVCLEAESYGVPDLSPQALLRSAAVPRDTIYGLTNPPVVVAFNAQMDRSLVEQGLVVIMSGKVVPGRMEWAADSSALTFFPATPVPPNNSGQVLLFRAPWNRTGVESQQIQTGPAPPGFAPIRWNLSGDAIPKVPSDIVFEIAFAQDMPADFVQKATAIPIASPGQPGNPSPLTLQVSQRTPRIFRLVHAQPLNSPSYNIEVLLKDGGKPTQFIDNTGLLTPESRRMEYGPTDAMGDVPVNGLLWLQAHSPLNALTVTPRLTTAGAEVRVITEVADEGRLVLLRPVGLLRSGATYGVELKGLEDLAGRPLPDRTWTFHTGNGPDFTTARVTNWSPKGAAAITARPQVSFSKPVYYVRNPYSYQPSLPEDFQISQLGVDTRGNIEVSPDGRTVTFVPTRPWPVDSPIFLPVNRSQYSDWTGLPIDDSLLPSGTGAPPYGPPFSTTSTAGAAPMVNLRNPQPDALDVPRNVRIRVRFFNGVLDSSLSGITLTTGDTVVPIQTSLAADGITLTIAPAQPLEANRRYAVNLAGVLSSDGIATDAPELWSFTTSSLAASTPGQPLIYTDGTDPFSFRILLERPADPTSIGNNSISVTLNQYPAAFDFSVEEGGRSLRVSPRVPLTATDSLSVTVTGVTDAAGLPFPNSSATYSALTPVVNTPPQVLAVLPVPGSTVPTNAKPMVYFDRPMSLRPGSAGARLSINGTVQPAIVSLLKSDTLAIAPMVDLAPGATCQVDIDGLMDANGREAAPLSWSFQITSDGVPDLSSLREVSISPARNAVGVPAVTPIVFEYSRPVSLGSDISRVAVSIYPALPFNTRSVSEKNQIRLEPITAWSAGTSVSATIYVRDTFGQTRTSTASFSTAASEDKTRPEVESVIPEPGSKVSAGLNQFQLRFTEPVTISGPFVGFSCNGSSATGTQATIPTQGDGRTVVVNTNLPGSTTCTMSLSSGLTDLSGNALQPITYGYTVDSADSSGPARVLTVLPADGSAYVPLDAAITLRFNQPMNEASVLGAVRVYNAGLLAQVTLTPDAANQVWTIVPATSWQPDSIVRVEVGATAYSASGLAFAYPFAASFRTLNPESTPASGASLAAVSAFADSVDVRFSGPVTDPPEEPFGLRQGQARIPVLVDRMGPAWFRLTPGTPLDAGGQYTLMAGPGKELPLRIIPRPLTSEDNTPLLERDQSGRLLMRFYAPIHAFSVDANTLVLLDRNGQESPHTARISPDGRTISIEPLGALPVEALRWKGHRLPIR